MKPYRNRTVPHKILTAILYSFSPAIEILGAGRVNIKTANLARQLYISNGQMIRSLEWLRDMGYIEKIDYPIRGTAIVSVYLPRAFLGKDSRDIRDSQREGLADE